MKWTKTTSLFPLTLIILVSFQCFAEATSSQQDVVFTIQMEMTYFNPSDGKNIWNLTEGDRTVGLFMNNAWQTVKLVESSFPLERTTIDDDGNPIATLQLEKSHIKPGESMSFVTTFQASSKHRTIPEITEEKSGTLDRIPTHLKEKFCKKGDAWQVDDSDLRLLASKIMGNETKTLTIVKRVINWIKSNISYLAHEIPHYPNETLANKSGDCDDQAILLITLCRIMGIPAYLQVGCIYQPTKERTTETYWNGHVTDALTRIAWHGWAFAYVPPWGFLPIDLTYVENPSDHLNAIRAGAVTFRETIQYMNVSQLDYIAQTRRNKAFLEENNFNIFMEDVMNQKLLPENSFLRIVQDALPYLVTVVVIGFLFLSLIYIRRIMKYKTRSN